MHGDAPARMRNLVAPIVIASALLAAAISAGCRTASVGASGDPDPALKAVLGSCGSRRDRCAARRSGQGAGHRAMPALPRRRADRAAAQRRRGLGTNGNADADVGHPHPGRRSDRARRVSRGALRSTAAQDDDGAPPRRSVRLSRRWRHRSPLRPYSPSTATDPRVSARRTWRSRALPRRKPRSIAPWLCSITSGTRAPSRSFRRFRTKIPNVPWPTGARR